MYILFFILDKENKITELQAIIDLSKFKNSPHRKIEQNSVISERDNYLPLIRIKETKDNSINEENLKKLGDISNMMQKILDEC